MLLRIVELSDYLLENGVKISKICANSIMDQKRLV